MFELDWKTLIILILVMAIAYLIIDKLRNGSTTETSANRPSELSVESQIKAYAGTIDEKIDNLQNRQEATDKLVNNLTQGVAALDAKLAELLTRKTVDTFYNSPESKIEKKSLKENAESNMCDAKSPSVEKDGDVDEVGFELTSEKEIAPTTCKQFYDIDLDKSIIEAIGVDFNVDTTLKGISITPPTHSPTGSPSTRTDGTVWQTQFRDGDNKCTRTAAMASHPEAKLHRVMAFDSASNREMRMVSEAKKVIEQVSTSKSTENVKAPLPTPEFSPDNRNKDQPGRL